MGADLASSYFYLSTDIYYYYACRSIAYPACVIWKAVLLLALALKEHVSSRGGHCIGDCTPTRDRSQSEVKRSRRNFEAGQAVKLGIGGSLSMVKVSPSDRWAWLMLDSQGSRPDFWCGQGVKHGNLLGQDLDPGRGWKYRRLCSITPLKLQSWI